MLIFQRQGTYYILRMFSHHCFSDFKKSNRSADIELDWGKLTESKPKITKYEQLLR